MTHLKYLHWGSVYIFEKQGKIDFRSPSVAKELIPFEDEFRPPSDYCTKYVLGVCHSSNYVARSVAGGDAKAFLWLFYEVVDPEIPF